MNSFKFNFDPVFFITINSFLKIDTPTNKPLYIIKSQETLDKQDEDKILSKLVLRLKSSTINFINKKTKTFLAFISF